MSLYNVIRFLEKSNTETPPLTLPLNLTGMNAHHTTNQ